MLMWTLIADWSLSQQVGSTAARVGDYTTSTQLLCIDTSVPGCVRQPHSERSEWIFFLNLRAIVRKRSTQIAQSAVAEPTLSFIRFAQSLWRPFFIRETVTHWIILTLTDFIWYEVTVKNVHSDQIFSDVRSIFNVDLRTNFVSQILHHSCLNTRKQHSRAIMAETTKIKLTWYNIVGLQAVFNLDNCPAFSRARTT
jgi:hypothetical protein